MELAGEVAGCAVGARASASASVSVPLAAAAAAGSVTVPVRGVGVRAKPRRASWETDLHSHSAAKVRRAVVARSWYAGYGALAEEEEDKVDQTEQEEGSGSGSLSDVGAGAGRCNARRSGIDLVMPSLKSLVSMATLSRRRSSSTTALSSPRETPRMTSSAKSVTALPLLREPLRKCETALTLSNMIPPMRPVNRLRVSTSKMCSRCSSILSMASSSRYSINTTGFVQVSQPDCRGAVLCKLCLSEVPVHLTWTLQQCSCTFCIEIDEDTNEKSSDYDDENGSVSSAETPADTSVSFRPPRPPVSKRKLNPVDKATTEALQLVGKKINSLKEDDSFDVYGKYVADKLRKINPSQIKFVEKLIGEVMFEAEMESLNRNSRIVGHLDTSFQQVNSHQNFGQLPYTPQMAGFAELRAPGQQNFRPQTPGFPELQGPGQQTFRPQAPGFLELQGPGQQLFNSQTPGFPELQGPGQQPFNSQTPGFPEPQGPGQQPFNSQTPGFPEPQGPGQQPFKLQTPGFSELQGPGQQPFNSQTPSLPELRGPGQKNFEQSVPEIAGSAKKFVENYDPNTTM